MAEQQPGGPVVVGPAPIYVPTITLWNRLEPRPRTQNFNRAMKAEIRDPLWMVSKQWQLGEFRGEDAGSAILAKLHMRTTQITKYQPAEEITTSFDNDRPLEVQVENRKIPFQIGAQEIAMDLRLLMGRHWLKLLSKDGLSLRAEYLSLYAFTPPDPTLKADAQVTAHVQVWQQAAAIANRSIDGYRLYQDLKVPGAQATDQVTPPAGQEDLLNELGVRFVAWFEKLYYQPVDTHNPSWKPAFLEHQFACSAPEGGGEKVLFADEYYHGHLDWYNLDIHDEKATLPEVENPVPPEAVQNEITLSFLPSPATFPGMPHSRWWQFEDWRTDLGKISPNTTDINQLMLLDFALNYANDWLLFPFTLRVGSLANVEGLMVTNVFGEHTWIRAAGRGNDETWNRWSMFHLNTRGHLQVPADLSLVLLPSAPKVLESQPLEEVYLLRDEIANMVWGLEARVPLATGKSKPGKEAAQELRSKLEQLIPIVLPNTPLSENEARIRYEIVNSVPEYWIPFIPVHLDENKREIQLQRAAMPRIIEGADNTVPPDKIEPRTTILREGLDQEMPQPYFVHEEEVPRAGIRVYQTYQRTRWYNGKVFTWLGFKKEVGRGEGHSGLAFDQIVPKRRE